MFKALLLSVMAGFLFMVTASDELDYLFKYGMKGIEEIQAGVPDSLQIPLICSKEIKGLQFKATSKGDSAGCVKKTSITIDNKANTILDVYRSTMKGISYVTIVTENYMLIINPVPTTARADLKARYIIRVIKDWRPAIQGKGQDAKSTLYIK